MYFFAGGVPEPLAPAGTPETIAFEAADGTVLRGRLWEGGDTAVLVVGAYGAAIDELDPILEPLARRGLTVMTYDLRGQGRSGGEVQVELAVADLEAAIGYLAAREPAAIHLAGYLHSGATAVVYAAGERAEIASLTLLFPMARYLELDAVSALPDVETPLLVAGLPRELAGIVPPQRQFLELVGQPADFRVRGTEIADRIAEFVDGISG
jgi:alpha-beta hydrolase superfamily lysophospholipase